MSLISFVECLQIAQKTRDERGVYPTLPSSPINVKVRLSHINDDDGRGASLSRPWTPSSLGPRPGNARCASSGSCVTCDLLIEGTKFKSMMSGKEYLFMPNVDCQVFCDARLLFSPCQGFIFLLYY